MSKILRSGLTTLAATGVFAVALPALGQAGGAGGGPTTGGPDTPEFGPCSTTSSDIDERRCSASEPTDFEYAASEQTLALSSGDTALDTGWQPSCDGTDHCDENWAQFKAALDYGAVDAQPIYAVTIADGTVQLDWDAENLYATIGESTDASLAIAHSLEPTVGVYIKIPYIELLSLEEEFNPTELLSLIDEIPFNDGYVTTDWSPVAEGEESTSAPWAFGEGDEAAIFVEAGTGNDEVTLLQLDVLKSAIAIAGAATELPDWVEILADAGSITVSLQVKTNTTFTWTTTSVDAWIEDEDAVALTSGGSTVSAPIVAGSDVGDTVEVTIQPKGELTWTGSIEMTVQPSVGVDADDILSLLGIDLPDGLIPDIVFDIPVPPVADWEVAGGKTVEMPEEKLDLPVPNVFFPTSRTINFPDALVGETIDTTVEIQNTGFAEAITRVESSDPAFIVEDVDSIAADGSADLVIKFRPQDEGPVSADITLYSNDPDSPAQVLTVTGIADGFTPDFEGTGGRGEGGSSGEGGQVDDGEPPTGDVDPGAGASDDGGCGCRTAGHGGQPVGAGLLALLGAALVGLRRRARR